MNILKNKTVLTLIAIAIIAVIGYAYLSSESAPSSSDLIVSSSGNSVVGADILSSLIQVNSLNLDPAIFTEINSLQLKDFSQDLPDNVPTGNPNPFQTVNFGRSTTTPTLPGGPQTFSTTTKPVGLPIVRTIPTVGTATN